ncbi:hemolysin secretion protein D [Pseudoxanthomonas sangjuensis]|uniref:HlyD family secretion protein n=1 Tax=Pseudoxanthomonas sangjuensis TaxID=1503750 RepID=UPI001391FBB6|nr:HlyD family efflux transporter periplasmic adaptor subunit [Pseudoxanthomonas sangjuensis]KAF1713269.1 hemolysin secretion protein D [Pseudoxanthomonas sangjuensis]
MKPSRTLLLASALLALAACRDEAPRALGTLEWDRIVVPAPAAEKIVRIDVREGQRVKAGDVLLQLEATRTQSQLQAVQAQTEQSREALAELKAGPRSEQIAQARASLSAAQAQAADARAYYNRLQPLGRQRLVAAADVDRARAAAGNAEAQVRAAQQALLELERGTRAEQIAQGEAAARAAAAQAAGQQVTLQKLSLSAPRDAQVDSLPYRLGAQAPGGAPLVVLLAGDAPYARLYVPEPLRAGGRVGDAVRVHVDGSDKTYAGTVRMVRSDPSFTPYYALTGQDAARLSYLAEVQLGADARELPAGLPVQVSFAGASP